MRAARQSLCAVMMLTCVASAALAQTTPPAAGSAPPPPVGPDPAVTTATYGDWVLRCQATTTGAGPARICEVVQTMQLQGQQQPVAQVAFGRAQGSSDLHLVAALPVNVSFPSRVVVALTDKDTHSLDLTWKRCIPGACFADAMVASDMVGRWRSAPEAGRIQFKDSSGRDLALPLSFRGLAPALDALTKAP